jgi:putative DNA primase/helicase
VDADRIGLALNGRRNGNGWLVSCPVLSHGNGRGDRNPSLSVSDGDDGRLLLKCFAGCGFNDIMDELRGRGLLGRECSVVSRFTPRPVPRIKPEPDKIALEIWQQAEPIYGTIAEEYLQLRGITLTPPALCHHRGAMVAAVTQPYHGITAIQKTPIKADLTRGERMTKGPLGNGAVRLGAAQRLMGIAEGVETALAATMLTGIPVWASLGSARLHSVELPTLVEKVYIFGDNDDAGRKAAERAGEVHTALGREVRTHFPREGARDFNDLIIENADDWYFNYE